MNIAELLIRNQRTFYLKMFIEEHIIEWNYKDYDGKTLNDILTENKVYENESNETSSYFKQIEDIVNANKEKHNLNELLSKTAVKKTSRLKRI